MRGVPFTKLSVNGWMGFQKLKLVERCFSEAEAAMKSNRLDFGSRHSL